MDANDHSRLFRYSYQHIYRDVFSDFNTQRMEWDTNHECNVYADVYGDVDVYAHSQLHIHSNPSEHCDLYADLRIHGDDNLFADLHIHPHKQLHANCNPHLYI
jgi:hypothetical protein